MVVQTNVSKKHRAGEDQSSRVGLVLALDVEADVTASRLENCDFTSHVASWNNTRATDKTSADIGEDTSVQVGHDHDIELLGPGDTLHGGVVDDHIIGLQGWVLLSNLLEGVAEKTVGELHDVCLVDAGDLLAVVGKSKCECELGDALRLGTSDDLEGLDDAGHGLMLQARVFAFSVLSDDAEVDVLVSGVIARNVLDQDDGCVNVELLSEGNVEGLMAGALNGRVEDTWP